MKDTYVTSVIHMSLEDFHNLGVTPEETRECIEAITDPGSGCKAHLRCEASGINSNWNVHTMLTEPRHVNELIRYITSRLWCKVVEKRAIENDKKPKKFVAKIDLTLALNAYSVHGE